MVKDSSGEGTLQSKKSHTQGTSIFLGMSMRIPLEGKTEGVPQNGGIAMEIDRHHGPDRGKRIPPRKKEA